MKTTLTFDEIPPLLQDLGSYDAVQSLVGEKAANLARISQKKVKIPQGFVITSQAYEKYLETNTLSDDLWEDILKQIKALEQKCLKFLGSNKPLILAISCTEPIPGVIGLGLNDYTAHQLALATELRELPFALFPKLISSYSSLVYGIDTQDFETLFIDYCNANEDIFVSDFKAYDWIYITKLFKSLFVKTTGKLFPQDPLIQLRECIENMFKQYSTNNVTLFRQQTQKDNKFSIGVQQFLFGDWDVDSFASVLSTHDYATGEEGKSGIFSCGSSIEYIINEYRPSGPGKNIDKAFPETETKTDDIITKVKEEFQTPMTINIVCQSNVTYVVSLYKSITGDCVPFSIVDNAINNKVDKKDALKYISPYSVRHIGDQQLSVNPTEPFAQGSAGSYGVAVGTIVFSGEECIKRSKQGENCILVKSIITGYDVEAINASVGCISITGNDYSECSYICRSLGKPAVFGVKGVFIDVEKKSLISETLTLNEGEPVTILGKNFYSGALPTQYKEQPEGIKHFIQLCDEVKGSQIKIYSQASDISHVQAGVFNQADGIGVVVIDDILKDYGQSIATLASNPQDEQAAKDIEGKITRSLNDIFISADKKEVTVRLLNNSLTYFLPSIVDLTKEIAALKTKKENNKDFHDQDLLDKKLKQLDEVKHHSESNPLMGTRGIRWLLVLKPLLESQIRAIASAIKAAQRKNISPVIRILLPCVTEAKEVSTAKEIIDNILSPDDIHVEIGAALEVPRACLTSKDISEQSDFIVVDTLSLQQTLFGMDKDDAEKSFIDDYSNMNIINSSPFISFDEEGAGDVIKKCISESTKPVGVIGQNCMNDKAISFLCKAGVTSFFCTPEYVPYVKYCIAISQ